VTVSWSLQINAAGEPVEKPPTTFGDDARGGRHDVDPMDDDALLDMDMGMFDLDFEAPNTSGLLPVDKSLVARDNSGGFALSSASFGSNSAAASSCKLIALQFIQNLFQ
jgi:hypothetical protein